MEGKPKQDKTVSSSRTQHTEEGGILDATVGILSDASGPLSIQVCVNVTANSHLQTQTDSQLSIGDTHITVDDQAVKEVIQQALTIAKEEQAKRNQQPLSTWNLPEELPYFVERSLLHDEIQSHFKDKNSTQILALTALSGLGGVGKTQLANHYIHVAANYTFKAWFKADSKETLQNDYWLLAKNLKLIDEQDKVEQAIAHLQRWFKDNPGWLLIYDNVKNKRDLYELLPKKGGHILMTSRSGNSWHLEEQIEVSTMSLAEGRALVKKLCGQEGEWVDILLEELGYLPLAITHAASYMRQKGVAAKDYSEIYEEEKLALIDKGELPEEDLHQPLLVTWRLNKDLLNKEHPKALEVLQYCAFLNSNHIPAYLLTSFLLEQKSAAKAKQLWGDVKQWLLNYSLITLTQDKELISIHPLLQKFLLAETKKADAYQLRLQKLLPVILQAAQEIDASMEDINRRRQLEPHLASCLRVFETEDIAQTRENQILKVNLLTTLADIYVDIGRDKERKALLETALPIRISIFGEKSYEVARVFSSLALAYGNLGDIAHEKELLEEKVLPILEELPEDDFEFLAGTKTNLANVYGRLGDSQRQKELLEESIQIKRKHYKNEEHYNMAPPLHNLAEVYRKLGDYKQQKDLAERALKIQKARYGEKHFAVARVLDTLADAYQNLGEVHEAKKYFEQALEILKAHFGDTHYEVGKTLNNLAVAHSLLGNYGDQRSLAEKAVAILRAHFGQMHLEVIPPLITLANACRELMDLPKSKMLLDQALEIQEKNCKGDNFAMGMILDNLADLALASENFLEQKSYAEKALKALEAHYGRGHYELSKTLRLLGYAEGMLDQREEAERMLKEVIKTQQNHFGENHYEVAKSMQYLASIYGHFEEFESELEWRLKAQPLLENYFGKSHPRIASNLYNLGLVYHDVYNLSLAKLNMRKASDIIINYHHNGQEHPLVEKIKIKLVEIENDLITALLEKYTLTDKSQASLEKGLRKAVVNYSQGKGNATLEDVVFFIELIDNINAKDMKPEEGKTALHHAVIKNNTDCAKLLLAAGADFSIADAQGMTALQLAKNNNYSGILSLFNIPAQQSQLPPSDIHLSLPLQVQHKEIAAMALPDKVDLQKQKKIFEDILVEELLQEVKYLSDVLAERAPNRKEFSEKALDCVTYVISKAFSGGAIALPLLAVGQILTDITGGVIQQLIENSKEKRLTVISDLFYAQEKGKVEAIFRRLAKAVSLRYEYVIGVLLSPAPNEGVIPFARVGARRLMEYLLRLSKEIATQAPSQVLDFPLDMDVLLDGFIQGHSGSWVNNFFTNHYLKAHDVSIKNLTAEGAYGRCAMRIMPQGQLSKKKDGIIYHRKEVLHKQQKEDKTYDWGRVKYVDDNSAKGPKYGFMYVDTATTQTYGYHTDKKGGEKFSDDVTKQLDYYPTIRIVDENDVKDYNKEIQKRVKESEPISFIEFIKQRYENANYPNYRIDGVWVKGADLENARLAFGNYADVYFSECDFNGATFEKCSFARANFSFLTVKNLKCHEVIFDQANFSYAVLEETTFDDKVSYVGTQWLGANLTGLKINDKMRDELQQLQQTQAKQYEQISAQLSDLHAEHEKTNTLANERYKSITAKLANQDNTLTELAQQMCQSQINYQALVVYWKGELIRLGASIEMISSEQNEFKEEQKKLVLNLQEQVNTLLTSKERYDNLLQNLDQHLAQIKEWTSTEINTLVNLFSTQHNQLQEEIYSQLNDVKERLSKVEKRLDAANCLLNTKRREISIRAFSNITVAKGGHAQFGKVIVRTADIQTGGERVDDQAAKWIEEMLKSFNESDLKVIANSDVKIDENGKLIAGDVDITGVRLDTSKKSQQSSSSSTNSSISSVPILRQVKFVYHPSSRSSSPVTSVHLAGDFNQWLGAENGIISPSADAAWQMRLNKNNETWEYEANLVPQTYACKVVLNSYRWFPERDDHKVEVKETQASEQIIPLKFS